jgi:hypothetical protein
MPLPQSVYQDPFGDLSFTRAAISDRIHQRQELIEVPISKRRLRDLLI